MRKLITLTSLLCASLMFVYAQERVDYRSLEKKLAKSNENITHEKKSVKMGTWMDRGELLVRIFNTYQENLTIGVPINTFMLLRGNAHGERDEKVAGKDSHVLETSRVDFYFVEDRYYAFKVTDPIIANPLQNALAAYQKAIELDPEKKKVKKVSEALQQLRNAFVNEGLNYVNLTNYSDALTSFTKASEVDEIGKDMPDYIRDSALYYYMGFTQDANEQYKDAFQSFQKSIDLGYLMNGEIYCRLAESGIKDSTLVQKSYDILKDAIVKFPDQKCIIFNLIDNSRKLKRDSKEIIGYIEAARTLDKSNVLLTAILGDVYQQLDNVDSAIYYYQKAYEQKPDWHEMLYSIALVNYNASVKYQNESLNLSKEERHREDELIKKSNDYLHKCIRNLEEFVSKREDHLEALDFLRQLYFRIRSEPGIQEKLDAIKQRIEKLGA